MALILITSHDILNYWLCTPGKKSDHFCFLDVHVRKVCYVILCLTAIVRQPLCNNKKRLSRTKKYRNRIQITKPRNQLVACLIHKHTRTHAYTHARANAREDRLARRGYKWICTFFMNCVPHFYTKCATYSIKRWSCTCRTLGNCGQIQPTSN